MKSKTGQTDMDEDPTGKIQAQNGATDRGGDTKCKFQAKKITGVLWEFFWGKKFQASQQY